jgi:hypothetical protein
MGRSKIVGQRSVRDEHIFVVENQRDHPALPSYGHLDVGSHEIALISSHGPASKSGQLMHLTCAEKGNFPTSQPRAIVCDAHALRLPI